MTLDKKCNRCNRRKQYCDCDTLKNFNTENSLGNLFTDINTMNDINNTFNTDSSSTFDGFSAGDFSGGGSSGEF